MHPRSRVLGHVLLSCLVALTAAVGCAGFPNASDRNTLLITQVKGPHAKVTIDLSAMRAAFGHRHVLSHDPDLAIATIRISVSGPGITQPLVASAPFTEQQNHHGGTSPSSSPYTYPSPYASGYPSTPPSYTPPSLAPAGPHTLSLLVPAGQNRVFKVEALNCSGKVLHSYRSLGSVTANVDLNVAINAANDAAARVLEHLLVGPQAGTTDPTGLKASLTSQDITAALIAYVTRGTGYEVGTNTFSTLNPLYFRVGRLVHALWAEGRPLLGGTQVPTTFLESTASTATITVSDGTAINPDTGLPARRQGAQVYLLDPFEQVARYTLDDGTATFQDVAPGTHTVLARYGNLNAWGTITVPEGDQAQTPVTLQVPAVVCPGTGASPSYSPTASPSFFNSPGPSNSPSSSPSALSPRLVFQDALSPGWAMGGTGVMVTPNGNGGTSGLRLDFPGAIDTVQLIETTPMSKAGYKGIKFLGLASGAYPQSFRLGLRSGGTTVGTSTTFNPGQASLGTGFDSVYIDFAWLGIADPGALGALTIDITEDQAASPVVLVIDDVELVP